MTPIESRNVATIELLLERRAQRRRLISTPTSRMPTPLASFAAFVKPVASKAQRVAGPLVEIATRKRRAK